MRRRRLLFVAKMEGLLSARTVRDEREPSMRALVATSSLAILAACGSDRSPEPVRAVASPSVSTDSGFEAADGNLNPQSPINFDWNSFAPLTWTGSAPNRLSSTSVSGWAFKGMEDAQASTTDDGFAGGTKQDQACASVIGSKAPNKDDLKRVYVASNIVNVSVDAGSSPTYS